MLTALFSESVELYGRDCQTRYTVLRTDPRYADFLWHWDTRQYIHDSSSRVSVSVTIWIPDPVSQLSMVST
jgi:hypothetical protein